MRPLKPVQAVLDLAEAMMASGIPSAANQPGLATQPLMLLASCLGLLASEAPLHLPPQAALQASFSPPEPAAVLPAD